MLKTLFATVLVAAALPVAPAFANDHSWQVGNDSMHIYYHDIDVNTASGRVLLLARVQRSAERLCRDRTYSRDCAIDAVKAAAELRGGASLQLALTEQGAVRIAAR